MATSGKRDDDIVMEPRWAPEETKVEGLGERIGSGREDYEMKNGPRAHGRACRRSGLNTVQFAEEGLFPEVESRATRMKGLARCGEELFYSVFRYVWQ
jgi:hypothetical protein